MICNNNQYRLDLNLTFCSGIIFKNGISKKMYTHTGVWLNSFLLGRYFQKWNFTQNVHPHQSFIKFQTGCKLLTLIDLSFQVCPLLDQPLVLFCFFCSFIWLCVNGNHCNWISSTCNMSLQGCPVFYVLVYFKPVFPEFCMFLFKMAL